MLLLANERLDEVKEQLKSKDYRLTPQREKILEVLLENVDTHLSAEDLFMLIKKKNVEVGLATVYRMLDLLEDMGIISRLDSGEGRSRYEMRSQEQQHCHHHLICLNCGTIAEFSDDMLEEIERSVTKKHGFQVTDHDLRVYGYCKNCRKN